MTVGGVGGGEGGGGEGGGEGLEHRTEGGTLSRGAEGHLATVRRGGGRSLENQVPASWISAAAGPAKVAVDAVHQCLPHGERCDCCSCVE
eukprot:1151838-Prymnesium_polylepis.2